MSRPEQQFAGARLGGVAVQLGEPHLQLGDLHAVFFAHLRQRVDAVALLLHLPQLRMTHDHGVEHRIVLEGELVLAQLADALVGVDADIARARLQIAAEDLHQGGLAAAVGADQAVAVAVAELDGDVLEQRLGPELHGDVGGGNQELSSIINKLKIDTGREFRCRTPTDPYKKPDTDSAYSGGDGSNKARILAYPRRARDPDPVDK